MTKPLLGIIGLILLICSIFVISTLYNGERLAAARDDKKIRYGMIDDTIPMCLWEVQSPEKIMTEDKSQAIQIKTSNTADKECLTFLSLRAPGFDISPAKEEQKIVVPPQGKGSISWILTPDKTGTFEVSISDTLNTQIYGITVTNVFGLNTLHAKILSWLGGLFGPMLTVLWWWDRLRGKKQQKKDQPKADSQTIENNIAQ
jgi:hypothetical protein